MIKKNPWYVLAILCLAACSDSGPPTTSHAISAEVRMAYPKFASRFATALTDGEYETAHDMLSSDMQQKYTAEALGNAFEAMVKYGGSPAKVDGFVETMEDWPDRKADEVGWAYVSISGDDYAEAVTVIVSADNYGMSISNIEWGRP